MASASSKATSLRALLLGMALVGAISYLSPWAILMVKGSQLTSNAIPIIAVVFFFLVIGLGTPVIKLVGRRFAFSLAELITVYAMMLIGSVVVTTGFTGSFLSVISGVAYYATPENNWGGLFLPYVHPWLAPTDPLAIRLFFEGLPKGVSIPWRAWALPLAAWTGFILVFYWQYCGHFLSEFSDDKSRNLIKNNTHVNLCFLNQTQEIKLTLI